MEPLIRDLIRRGLRREALALRAVAEAYGTMNLADLIALLNVATASPSATARIGQLDRLVAAFEEATAALGTPPADLRSLLVTAVTDGTTTGAAMLAAGSDVAEMFRVTPERELRYMQHVSERLARYWGEETLRMRREVQSVLLEGLERGTGSRELGARLRDRISVSRSRANLIARNEVGNAAAFAMRELQTEAGSTHYVWRSASDERVRPEHRKRNGRVFAWTDPPADGHPGQPIQCRCVALALPPGVSSPRS